MVVQISGGVEHTHSVVDHGHARASMHHIFWHLTLVGGIWQYAFAQRRTNSIPMVFVQMLEVFTPSQLKHQLVLHAQTMAMEHHIGNVWNA